MAESFARRVKGFLSSFLNTSENSKNRESHNVDDVDTGGRTTTTHNPRDRADFFKRTHTYTVMNWFAMPLELSPIACSQYGWQAVDVNMLRCVHCTALVCAELPKVTDSTYKTRFQELVDSIKTGHDDLCPWPLNPSPDFFLELPLLEKQEAVADYMSRVDKLQTLGTNLPSILCDDIDISDRDKLGNCVRDNLEKHDMKGSEDDSVLHTAAVLSTTGWSNSEDKSIDSLVCSCCGRQIGLWDFKNLKNVGDNKTDSNSNGEPHTKRARSGDDDLSCFDPVSQHRNWCLWVTPTNTSNEVGWKVLMKLLLPSEKSSNEHITTPKRENIENVKKLINNWSSPTSVTKLNDEINIHVE